MQLVWLKRDLRLDDHTALCAAAAQGPVAVLYCWEPGLWQRPEYDASHARFVAECLDDLRPDLAARGVCLVERTGRIRDVLASLHREVGIDHLHSHEETGIGWTYGRDKAVARWCAAHEIRWTEHQQTGVFRRLPSRNGWARRWETFMRSKRLEVPTLQGIPVRSERRPDLDELGVQDTGKSRVQRGGASLAQAQLDDFLKERSLGYRRSMSSPLTAETRCSRLSTHLAWGTLSPRTVWQRTQRRMADLTLAARAGRADPSHVEDLDAWDSRLRWRDHFVQKLEDEPALEFRNGHRGYDRVRRSPENWGEEQHRRHIAWITGKTGLPMVDASMRMLHATGWLNFRMRAMLASVATYHLWLHWRPPAVALAPHFLDFEPGIHFAQFQMQAGTMGINTHRIYNPAKQARDQDPDGDFIRRWVPELARLPTPALAEPWRAPPLVLRASGVEIGETYPAPVVDPYAAAAAARRRMEEVRRRLGHRGESRRVQERHGSRRRRPMGQRR